MLSSAGCSGAALRAELTRPMPPPPTRDDDVAEKICVRGVDGMPWVTDFASYATQIAEPGRPLAAKPRAPVQGRRARLRAFDALCDRVEQAVNLGQHTSRRGTLHPAPLDPGRTQPHR